MVHSLALALFAPLIPALAPAAGPSFAEAWYRETVLGEIAAAGEQYQKIYDDLGSGAARPPAPPDLRRKAALRAGLCFEKLGDLRRAQAAYSFLLRHASPDDPLHRSARLRLLDLPPEGPEAPAPVPGGTAPGVIPAAEVPATPPVETNPVLERLQARVAQREACVSELRAQVRRRTDQAAAEARLRRRLLELGVEVGFEEASRPGPAGEAEGFEKALDAEDRDILESELAERFYLRALRALRDRNAASAVEDLRKTLHLRADYRDAADLLKVAEGFLQPMQGIAERAAFLLRERRESHEAELPLRLKAALLVSERLGAEERVSGALAELERARSEEDWAPPPVRRGAETRALGREVDSRALLLGLPPPAGGKGEPGPAIGGRGAPAERYHDLRSRGKRAAAEVLAAAEELVDLRSAGSERRRPGIAPAGALVTHEAERAEAGRRVASEIERLIARGQERHRTRPQEGSPEGFKRDFRDALTLLDWFPELDGDRRLRKLAQDYLAR